MAGEHTAPLEVRVAGRTLTGEAIRYGEPNARPAPGVAARSEMFLPGSVELLEPVTLNLQHDPQRRIASTGDGDLRVTDSPEALRIEADLREGSAELELVRRGALTGLSVEFYAIREGRSPAGLRALERAAVPAIGLVDRGSYATSVELRRATETLNVELRARMGRSMSVGMPSGRRVACECSGPGCRFAEFMADEMTRAFDEAFERAERDLIATWANYSQPLASKSRGTLRRTGATDVEIDLPDDDYGRAALAAHESTGVVVRPYLDPVESQGRREGETMVYDKVSIRAFVVSSTDAREGWPEPRIVATPDIDARAARRTPLWL